MFEIFDKNCSFIKKIQYLLIIQNPTLLKNALSYIENLPFKK